MLNKLKMRNFKRFGEEVEIELGNPVVFIGPNNSGKTTAMQALALWEIGLRRWNEKRSGKSAPEKRPGVTVNRRDLVAIPVPAANLLWHDLRLRATQKVNGKQLRKNILIDLIVEGETNGHNWSCGLEFDYADEESFYCRPIRLSDEEPIERMSVPDRNVIGDQKIAFLPPMSGLAATETRLDRGAIDVRIGEGRTAEVLRNLCYRIHENSPSQWSRLVSQLDELFNSQLRPPRYITERGEIEMAYREHNVELDLSSAGRGLQQTLLLLAYMYANPGSVLLLDEPDAHLEILRQRQIYHLLTEVAEESGNQIIAASHSEVLLNEAARRDKVIAFVGRPHRIGEHDNEVIKALSEIGFDQYYQAEQNGWVLYLEGPTDLTILQAMARRLKHEKAICALDRVFVHFVGNQPRKVQKHYCGLREACPELVGVALFDRLKSSLPNTESVVWLMWTKREIENYLCSKGTLGAFAKASASEAVLGPLFTEAEIIRRGKAMENAIAENVCDVDVKASEEFLVPVLTCFYKKIEQRNQMPKNRFYQLVKFIPEDEIDPEITEKLDAISKVAQQAQNLRKR